MAQIAFLPRIIVSADTSKAPLKPLRRTQRSRTSISTNKRVLKQRTFKTPSKAWMNEVNKTIDSSVGVQKFVPRSPLQRTKLNVEVSPHRAVSAVRLMRIELGGAFADLLNEKGKGSGDNEMGYVERTLGFCTKELDDRDLRLVVSHPVTDVVGGTIRWRRYLDHLICSLCHEESTFRHMEPLLLQILRIGVYEIVKLDMPPYAVVDENVRLAKVALRPGAGNMVNGILRKLVVLKEKNSLPLPILEGDDHAQARALATLHSHPVWMVRRWTKYRGQEEAIKLMVWNNSDPGFSLRANVGRGVTRADLVKQLNLLKVPHELSLHLDDFIRMKTGLQTVIQAGLLKQGLCAVQDESAGLVVSVVDAQPGESIVDCCAAPGGKTVYMASRMSGQGMVYAIDINKGRLRILRETAKLHQVSSVITTIHSDLRIFADNESAKYDKVLLDAPCSGLGVLSKVCEHSFRKIGQTCVGIRAWKIWKNLKICRMSFLDAASLLVKPGGVLIYSTCSIDPEENEERVDAFLLRHPEFSVDPVDRFVPPDFVSERSFYFFRSSKTFTRWCLCCTSSSSLVKKR
ncbi:hypothetical protein Pint_03846 [Pistacia integerrima]|uniref:Uncharacterized protein n=1 Tax=Pistacia integerrima TaxID=434235 RepID=A0ACC0Z6V5_9ROSI|nr:hypothetical protein Pint_03846 [Pistacia integerrima]